MAKYIKRYNAETEKWELVSAPDVTVIHEMAEGEKISDTDVIVTNYNYSETGETVSLNDTLTTISDDIARLQRNVSWLGEHGGGGGGGSYTGSTNYGIEIISPIIENNVVYISTTSFSVKFKLTGGTSDDEFQYRYVFDGTETSEYTKAVNEREYTVTIRNINSVSDSSVHSFLLEAITPMGTTIRKNFRIYENSLSISVSSANTISNGEVILTMNGNGLVKFDVKNGIMNSNTNLHFSCNGESDLAYQNDTTSVKQVSVNIWEVIDKTAVEPDDLYIVTIYAQATYGMTVNNRTENLVFGVRIRNANQMAIYFDGLTYESDIEEEGFEPTSIELNGRLKFNFRVYLPILVTDNIIYYAIKLVAPNDEEYFVAGETFDDNAYNTNILDTAQKYISAQIPLASYYVQDGWKAIVKAWSSSDKTVNTSKTGVFNIISTNSNIYPRQHNKRFTGIGNASADTCIFTWDSSSLMKNDTWTSFVRHYMPSYGDAEEISTTAYIKTYNTNGRSSGFITSESVPYMRLQNEAYAIADMSDYPVEIAYMTNHANEYGFNISLTFKADDLADETKTVFLWGANDGTGNLSNGVKVSLAKAEWYIHADGGKSTTLTAHVRPGKKNTVDFMYDGEKAYIIVDGVVCAAEIVGLLDQSALYQFGTRAYFAANMVNNTFTDFADTNVYEFAVYTQHLNMLQIAVNGKNARLDGQISEDEILEDYLAWKEKNLIYNVEGQENRALSYLIDSETGEFKYEPDKLAELQAASPLPIIMIDANATDFTEEFFHGSYDKSITSTKFNCGVQYFVKGRSVSFNANISLQGTSTLSYYIKNLEMVVTDPCSEDPQKTKLLQVREDWFPEREYTLKADVVDSAHANNATIGYWINHECKIMQDNPAMDGFSDAWRPKDINANGAPAALHADTRPETLGQEIDFDEKVTIKHNLEGFPVLMLIRFGGRDRYDFIGIYSFNLGRYSYYNMGMKFLKEFSRRTGTAANDLLPALIDHYVEYGKDEPFGDNAIKTSDVFSYEFGANADDNDTNHQTWTQNDIKVLQFYGEFNFNGAESDPSTKVADDAPIWNKLSNLFGLTATMGGATSNLAQRGFGGKEKYTSDGEKLIPAGGNPYSPTETSMEDFDSTLSVNNATSYFVIATALGMIDSLGKNLTLRTWDGGTKWWTVFYDMDSALALSNEGDEGISETAFIDSFYNTEDETGVSQLAVISHDPNSKYGNYNSKLWAIFRDPLFLYINNGSKSYYNSTWTALRSRNGALESYSKFISIMENQVGNCGELIYDYDYENKYIGPGANLNMLHGTRIEYVRNWLKKRIYFLDGVFEDSNANAGNFSDSPFYVNKFNVTNRGHNGAAVGFIPYRFKTTTPVFVKINTGNVEGGTDSYGKYFIPAYTETEIHTIEHTSTKQTSFTSSQLFTQLDGLDGIQVTSLNTNQAFNDFEVLTSLVNFSISGARLLQNNPIVFENNTTQKNGVFIFGGESSLETIDLSNTAFADNTATVFNVHLTDYQKIKSINISNSPVTNLLLPASVLQYLNVRNSNIDSFVMQNQPILQSIDFTGCQNIQTIDLLNCAGLRDITMSSIPNLAKVSINGCSSIEEIRISDDSSLAEVKISNNNLLRRVVIEGCDNTNLSIEITNCAALEEVVINDCEGNNAKIKISDSPLQSLTLKNLETANVVELPSRELLSGFTYLRLDNVYEFGGFKYGDEEAETYMDDQGNECYVLNIEPLVNLPADGVILRNVQSLKYMRVNNDEENPFEVTESTFSDRTKNLVRIFGHIKIISSPFNGMKNFFINHDERYSDTSKTEVDFVPSSEDRYYTNVSFDATDLNGWFSNTNLDINDAYYILFMCNESTKNLGDLFNGCKNIITTDEEPIRPDTFFKCSGVTNIDGIFGGCSIGGTLSDPLPGDEGGNVLLNPFIGNLTSFNNVFSGDYKINNISSCFFPDGCIISAITGFNPKPGDGSYLNDDSLLSNLRELRIIDNSFNKTSIDFGMGEYDATDLFRNNTELLEIKDSFVDINGYGTIRNIFGEYSDGVDDEGHPIYPSKLTTITHSFIFSGGRHDKIIDDGTGEYYDSDNVVFPIGNSLFKHIKSTIKYIGNRYLSNRTDRDYQYIEDYELGSFTGPGLTKYLANADFYSETHGRTEPDDCNGEGFPYHIFDGCVNLKEIPSFFENVVNFGGYDPESEKETEVEMSVSLPGNMFMNCGTQLTNISKIFNNMSKSIKCTLTSEGFKNLSLVNVESAFRGVNVVGKIPAKLFYQEKEQSYTENPVSGLTESQANALNITGTNGHIGRTLNASEYSVFNESYKALNPTIKNMAYALSQLTSTEMRHYTASISSLDDLVEDNPSYNPLKYILSGDEYVLNSAFDPYKKVWNKYIFDNDWNFCVLVRNNTATIPTVSGYPIVDINALPEEFTETYINAEASPTIHQEFLGMPVHEADLVGDTFAYTNYLCPPDIFRYCKNEEGTSVSGALSYCSGKYDSVLRTISGIRGKIPNSIFEPLSELTDVTEVFAGNQGIYPYRWASGIANSEQMGIAYYPNLLAPLTKATNVSSMFSGTKIWGHTRVPVNLFSPVTGITNVSSFWDGCYWVTGATEQIAMEMLPQTIFSPLVYLYNISRTLAGNNESSVPYVTVNLLSRSFNSRMRICNSFMHGATKTKGAVPDIWNWDSFGSMDCSQAYGDGYGNPLPLVDNKDSIHTRCYRII